MGLTKQRRMESQAAYNITVYWHLYIHEEEIGFYDNGADNPGMAGTITNLTEDQITIRIDMDCFEEYLGDWQIIDGTIILNYDYRRNKTNTEKQWVYDHL